MKLFEIGKIKYMNAFFAYRSAIFSATARLFPQKLASATQNSHHIYNIQQV